MAAEGALGALRFFQFGASVSNGGVFDLCDFGVVSRPAE
jgi:hypothetical protein